MNKRGWIKGLGAGAIALALGLLSAAAPAPKPTTKPPKAPPKPPEPASAVLRWTPVAGEVDKYKIVIDVNGTARITLFNQTAKGTVTEGVSVQKLEDMPNGLLRMKVKCKIESSTLPAKVKVLEGLMCADDSDFLMHPMNPYNVGLYPFPPEKPVAVGEEWPYATTWSDSEKKGKIDAKYKLISIRGDLAEIDAKINYVNDTLGFFKQHQETVSDLKAHINIKTGKLSKVTGAVKSKGNVPTTSYDISTTIQADLQTS